MWVPATLEFQGKTWTNVGVRFKGNLSLRSSWSSGSAKLPLKLDFDQFEDDHPEIANQRFYGFKQLSLASGFGDATYMRERTAYALLEAMGLVAAKTAYYEVLLDNGAGTTSLGLYVVIKVVDDADRAVSRQRGRHSGVRSGRPGADRPDVCGCPGSHQFPGHQEIACLAAGGAAALVLPRGHEGGSGS